MIRRYKNYGLAAVGVVGLAVAVMFIFGKSSVGFFPDPVSFAMALVMMVASFFAVMFFIRAKGYPWVLSVLVGASIFTGLGFIAFLLLLLLPDRPLPPTQHV